MRAYNGALARAKCVQQSTMGKKIWLSMRPRNFGNHVTVHALLYTTGIPMQNNSFNRYGNLNATRVFGQEIVWLPGRFREKKQKQSQVRLNFRVFTDVVNGERA